ncbi:MAG: SHD1 domain-containing protein [Planctomycetota bacterium]
MTAVAQPTESPIYQRPVEAPAAVVESPTPIVVPSNQAEILRPTSEEPGAPAADQQGLPPAPLAIPEAEDSAAESEPAIEPLPIAPAVDDRYSGFSEPTDSDQTNELLLPDRDSEIADSADDIFLEPPTTTADEGTADPALPAPVTQPEVTPEAPTDSDFDELFGTPSEEEEEEPASVSASEPAELLKQPEPATPKPATPESVDPEPVDPVQQPSESEPEEEKPFDPFYEDTLGLSGQLDILSSAGGLRGDGFRTWTDNTGSFRCRAKLLRVTTKGVTLGRPTGKPIAVPLTRLAEGDLRFVRDQIVALRIVRANDQAADKLAAAWSR